MICRVTGIENAQMNSAHSTLIARRRYIWPVSVKSEASFWNANFLPPHVGIGETAILHFEGQNDCPKAQEQIAHHPERRSCVSKDLHLHFVIQNTSKFNLGHWALNTDNTRLQE